MVGKHMTLIIEPLGTVTQMVDLPPNALPMALLRTLFGLGACGILASIIKSPG
ncbi:MAG: hypothetical protein P8M79_05645 [Alphaproteobacteria bacterium]|jgi:spore maturation protein SpmB|nr:hypothetical protein [Alphaproteobacteria bacterium]